ncbi:MAG: hypothetical protein D3923_03475, partial [Candidatus Electrothrix sp. AR3]|nr:hypothetical protein [Candidatus Electrothrix sp. AR3]
TWEHNGGSEQIPHIHTALTDDLATFEDAVDTMVDSGWTEDGYRAIYESATDTIAVTWDGSPDSSLHFTGAPYCNILITDETLAQGTLTELDAIDAMLATNGHFFGILPTGLFPDAEELANQTGGQLFDLYDFRADPQPVIDAVIAACVSSCNDFEMYGDSIIYFRNWQVDNDDAQFKMKEVEDIEDAAQTAKANNGDVKFQFGPYDDPIYTLTVDHNDPRLRITDRNMRYTEGNLDVIRCVFASEQCVVNIEGLTLQDMTNTAGDSLDSILTGDMNVTLTVGETEFRHSGPWTQYESGSGSWTKFRKD